MSSEVLYYFIQVSVKIADPKRAARRCALDACLRIDIPNFRSLTFGIDHGILKVYPSHS